MFEMALFQLCNSPLNKRTEKQCETSLFLKRAKIQLNDIFKTVSI